MKSKILLAIAILFSANWFSTLAQEVDKSDWPQILGFNRDGVVVGTTRLSLDKAPKAVWSVDVGEGLSGPVVSGDSIALKVRDRSIWSWSGLIGHRASRSGSRR